MPVHSLSDLIAPGAILASVGATSQGRLMARFARAAAPLVGCGPRDVARVLARREAEAPTALGGGVALPHARLPGIARPVGLLARLEQPVPWGAMDGEPVDLAVCLLSPEAPATEHLRALARLTRALRDRSLVSLLRGARDADSIAAILGGPAPAACAA